MESEKNAQCYEFRTFDERASVETLAISEFIDATYVITMESSTRKRQYTEQLVHLRPTKIVWIMTNKGIKSCKKTLYAQTTRNDIIDANMQVFRHANEQGYRNILVLEDDFVFDDANVRNPRYVHDVSECMKRNESQPMYYNLGPVPMMFYPSLNVLTDRNIRGITATVSHANIYNRVIRDAVLMDKIGKTTHWDCHLTEKYLNYFHLYPLCYQTFPETENKQMWTDSSNWYERAGITLFTHFISVFRMDVNPLPGYTILYAILFILNYTALFVLMGIIVSVMWYVTGKIPKKIKGR